MSQYIDFGFSVLQTSVYGSRFYVRGDCVTPTRARGKKEEEGGKSRGWLILKEMVDKNKETHILFDALDK